MELRASTKGLFGFLSFHSFLIPYSRIHSAWLGLSFDVYRTFYGTIFNIRKFSLYIFIIIVISFSNTFSSSSTFNIYIASSCRLLSKNRRNFWVKGVEVCYYVDTFCDTLVGFVWILFFLRLFVPFVEQSYFSNVESSKVLLNVERRTGEIWNENQSTECNFPRKHELNIIIFPSPSSIFVEIMREGLTF